MLTDEQAYLRETVRDLLERHAVRATVPAPNEIAAFDGVLWKLMAEQVGLQGLAIPEELGGAGAGVIELAQVFEQMGSVALNSPFFATVGLAATALMASGHREICAEYLPRVAAGEAVGTLAMTEAGAGWDGAGIRTTAERSGAEWILNGRKNYVVDGCAADFLVVVARVDDRTAVFLVDCPAPGLECVALNALDPTRPLAEVTFSRTPARLICDGDAAWSVIRRTLDRAAVYLAAEQLGGAARCLEMSVDYAKTRVQFGRPIGSFQAIKHKCADMLVAVELARSAVWKAASAASGVEPDCSASASLAKAVCSDAFVQCATSAIQIHGGIGFTWEHPAHLYYKRARSSEVLLGSPAYHRRLLLQHGASELPL
ncbi:acyl-CoA dehydrogenase family protein [Nocardia sp. NBC_01388]|uniref:acyl-CoA dehydrogenase family protein n=1 Tax=Nocardia sp. NBC_01388 TaxID=2903596 RepID=UPI003253A503